MENEKKIDRADFHIHYTDNTVLDILDEAKEKGIKYLALIQRLNIPTNVGKNLELGKERGINLVLGVEFSTKILNKYSDFIALGFDYDSQNVRKYWGEEEKRENNSKIAKIQMKFLEDLGADFSNLSEENKEQLRTLLNGDIVEKAITFCNILTSDTSNSEFVRYIKQANMNDWNYIEKKHPVNESFSLKDLEAKFIWYTLFSTGREGHLAIEQLSLQMSISDVIEDVHIAHGITLYSPEGNFDLKVWNKLDELGIDGIMAWHGTRLGMTSMNGAEAIDIPPNIIRNIHKNKVVLGGSDFDPKKNDWQIGHGRGDMFISLRRGEDLFRRLKAGHEK